HSPEQREQLRAEDGHRLSDPAQRRRCQGAEGRRRCQKRRRRLHFRQGVHQGQGPGRRVRAVPRRQLSGRQG
ncbi:hypothetical protein PMAYCL1PPCAC_21310, partial [Pristionchus mayeri]